MTGLIERAADAILGKDVLPLIYKDLAQPGVKQVGAAIETVLSLGNTLLLPLRGFNERANAAFTANMERYRKSLAEVPVESIREVPAEIAVPILERLTYVSDEAIAGMFVQLLANASQEQHAGEVHPAFVQLIDNMSPDEARLIKALKPQGMNIYGMYYVNIDGGEFSIEEGHFLFAPQTLAAAQMIYPNLVSTYMENLIRLGIFTPSVGRENTVFPEDEKIIRDANPPKISQEAMQEAGLKVAWWFGYARYTEFGKFFRRSCRLDVT